MENKKLSARERYELRHPLIETIGNIEIRKDTEYFYLTLSSPGLWSMHFVKTLEDARDWAFKTNELLDYGFMLYGFNSVCVFDYEKLISFAKTARKSQLEKYWLYI